MRFSHRLLFSATAALLCSSVAFAKPAYPVAVARHRRHVVAPSAKLVRAAHMRVPSAHLAAAPIAKVSLHRSSIGATAASAGAAASLHTVSRMAPAPIVRGGPWIEPTYADSTQGDFVDGEDLDVRRAAVEALGPFNGSVVAVDPTTGRILTMVNQRVALSSGFQPCSTIKVSVALAALSEQAVDPSTVLFKLHRQKVDMTYALAHSINEYFASLGLKLGFQKVSYYAHLFGYGEKAGLDIPGEQPGAFPSAPPQNGGVGMLTSFGEEIQQTPLQLAALMSAIANGGTLYYLQAPRTQAEAASFIPRVKRRLDIAPLIPQITPGMRGAVEFGTARRISDDNDQIAGKTGTCSNNNVHLGWFGSYNQTGNRKVVVVVLLTGGKPSIGPQAAGVAGEVYRHLSERNYFASKEPITPASLVSRQICCSQ